MPLQIRRGLNAERTQIAPTNGLVEGELLYTTDEKKLYIGTGSVGEHQGVVITGYNDSDAKDAAAQILTTGEHSGIGFIYDSETKKLNATVDLSTYDGPIVADEIKGSILANDDSVLLDAVDKILYGDVTGNLLGNVTGNINGVVTGTFGSSLIGNVTGNVTGNIFTSLIDSADSSAIIVTPSMVFQSNIEVENEIRTPSLFVTEILSVNGDIDNGNIVISGTTIYATTGLSISSNVKVRLDSDFNLEGKLINPIGDIESTALFNVFVSTEGENLKILADAPIYGNVIKPHNGVDFIDSAALVFLSDGETTTGADSAPMRFGLFIGDGVNSLDDSPAKLFFDKTGTLSVPVLQTGVYTTTPTDDRPTGVKGMIIFNDTSGTFQGFNGSAWVNLS